MRLDIIIAGEATLKEASQARDSPLVEDPPKDGQEPVELTRRDGKEHAPTRSRVDLPELIDGSSDKPPLEVRRTDDLSAFGCLETTDPPTDAGANVHSHGNRNLVRKAPLDYDLLVPSTGTLELAD